MSTEKANEMVKLIHKAMEDKKAEDIKIIDIADISTIADYFIICSGSNSSQLEAIIDNISETLGRAGYESKRTEGGRNSGWVLIDYGDVVVHIFSKEDRLFYDLERIWRDGKTVDIADIS
ncbi:MAG: ribosome silencing factor [Lachnospiraceae bacterium]|nr:ribosome silencing factor [Lachnospiraceae bacterium]